MARWDQECRIRRVSYLSSRSLKPDIDWRRVRSCSRNRSWADCTKNTRLSREGGYVKRSLEADNCGPQVVAANDASIHRRTRLGGMLSYYHCIAA